MCLYYKWAHKSERERNIPQTVKRRSANCIGHTWRRNCLLKHVTEGKINGGIEVTRRGARRRKQLLDDLMEKRGQWKLKEEALECTLWRTRFGRGYGPVVRQTAEFIHSFIHSFIHMNEMSTQSPPTQIFIGFYYLKLHCYMFRQEFWLSSDRYMTHK
jgi:hypothetical protein